MNVRTLFSLLILFALSACAAPNGVADETQPNQEAEPAASAPAVPTIRPATEETAPASATAIPATAKPITATTAITSTETVTATEAVTGTEALQGSFYAGEGDTPQPGVLLLHMIYGQRKQWNPLIPALVEGGYSVLALDIRGHGETGGEMDWEQAGDDLQRALKTLAQRPEVNPERVGVLGASMGANMAMITAAARPEVRAAVLLSPGTSLFGVSIDDDLPQYGPRPLLIVASQGDDYAARSAEKLAGLAEGEVELKLYPGSEHGTEMFARPDLVPLIVAWLDKSLKGAG